MNMFHDRIEEAKAELMRNRYWPEHGNKLLIWSRNASDRKVIQVLDNGRFQIVDLPSRFNDSFQQIFGQ